MTRLQEYLNRVVIFKKDAKPEEIKAAVQTSVPLPLAKHVPTATITTGKVADQPVVNAYLTIHNMRMSKLATHKNVLAKRARAAKAQKK